MLPIVQNTLFNDANDVKCTYFHHMTPVSVEGGQWCSQKGTNELLPEVMDFSQQALKPDLILPRLFRFG